MSLDPAVAEELGVEQFPIIGGHEGAGEVVEVGPGVTTLQPGDHVVLGFIPSCGRCPFCATGKQNLCDLGAYLLAGRQVTDFTVRATTPSGKDLGIMCCIGTFGEYTVVRRGVSASRSSPTSRSTRRRSSVAASPPGGARPSTPPTSAGRDRRGHRLRRRRHERRAGRGDGRALAT